MNTLKQKEGVYYTQNIENLPIEKVEISADITKL